MDVSVHSNWLSSTIGIQLIWTKYPLSNNNMDSKDKRCKFLLKEVPYQQNKSPLKFFIPKKWTMYWTTIRIRHSKLHTKPIYLATTQSSASYPTECIQQHYGLNDAPFQYVLKQVKCIPNKPTDQTLTVYILCTM